MQLGRLAHLMPTVAGIDASCAFYAQVLGMRVATFGEGRTALEFGEQKINLHRQGQEVETRARVPTPGSADLCLLTATPLAQVAAELGAAAVPIEAGPVQRSGACGPILSLCIRDPGGNLIEIANALRARAPRSPG